VRRIPVTLVSGFLGAGKTTFMNCLLTQTPVKAGVIVNDFGALNVDARLLEKDGRALAQLANGCVCCSLGDDFFGAVDTLLAVDPALGAIFVEASGVADPGALADFVALDRRLALLAIVTLVDCAAAVTLLADARIGATCARQIAPADLIVLSKADVAAPDAARAAIMRLAPQARIIIGHEAGAMLALAEDFGAAIDARDLRSRTARQNHEAQFVRFAFSSDRPFDRARLMAGLARAPLSLLRLKGFCALAGEEGCFLLQVVGRRAHLTPAPEQPPCGARLAGVLNSIAFSSREPVSIARENASARMQEDALRALLNEALADGPREPLIAPARFIDEA
jgi:G3E family GTPase